MPWVTASSAKSGNPTYLQPTREPPVVLTPGTTPEAAAMAFFTQFGSIFGIVDAAGELVPEDSGPDESGGFHASFTQKESQLPVYATRLAMGFDAQGRIGFVSGLFVPGLRSMSTQASLPPATAIAHAQADVATRYSGAALAAPLSNPPPQLVFYPLGASPAVLAARSRSRTRERDVQRDQGRDGLHRRCNDGRQSFKRRPRSGRNTQAAA